MKNHCSHASGAYKVTPPGNSFMLLVSSSSPQFCFKDAVNVLQAIARLVLLAGMPSSCLMIAESRSPCCCQLRGFRWEANVQKSFLPFHGCGSHCESASSNWTEEPTAGPKQAQCLSSLCLQGGLALPQIMCPDFMCLRRDQQSTQRTDHQALKTNQEKALRYVQTHLNFASTSAFPEPFRRSSSSLLTSGLPKVTYTLD